MLQAGERLGPAHIGVLASLAAPLAAAEVSIFVVSTFDTDYLLVKEARLPAALEALAGAGITVDGAELA